MEELYRFLLLRAPEELDLNEPNDAVVDLSQNSNFQQQLQIQTKQIERSNLASDYQNGPDFIPSLADWDLGTGLRNISYQYLDLDTETPVLVDNLLSTSAEIIAEALQETNINLTSIAAAKNYLVGFVQDGAWDLRLGQLKDSILAIRESSLHARILPELVAIFHAMRLIEKLVDTTETNFFPAAILKASLYLPGTRPFDQKVELEVLPEEDQETVLRESREYQELKTTIEELLHIPVNLLDVVENNDVQTANPIPGVSGDDDLVETVFNLKQTFLGTKGLDRLSETSLQTMQRLRLTPEQTQLGEVLDVLRTEQKNLSQRKSRSLNRFSNGARFVKLELDKSRIVTFPRPSLPLPPTTTGDVSPAGVGDLMVVKQKLKRYESGDVAHIENVLQGESKLREHRQRHLTEDTFFDEEEFETKEEQETVSKSRFELRSEVQKAIKRETSVGAGVKVSAKYGPMVKIDSNAKFAYKNAQQESRKRASSVSKELVEKAATTYTERFKSSRTRRVLHEVEELNRHSLDATNAIEHIVGVYQWVNKVYEAQVFNYGQRVMYEFMVPEPAAYYIWALSQGANQGKGLKAPPTFSLDPNDIDELNYAELAAIYEAVDMPVPPEPFVTVDSNKSGGPNPEKGPMIGSDRISIPEGYEYYLHATRSYFTGVSSDNTRGFNITVSTAYKTAGTVPIAYSGYSIKSFSYYVHLLCRRTNNAMEKWRMKAWEALRSGHERQTAEYEEKLAALMAKTGVEIEGRNPFYNRKVERRELQKSCLTLLTGTHPSWLDATNETAIGPVPSLVWSKSHGNYVRFMEQAYEWENMSYVMYPYFWARSSKWLSLQAIQDIDPEFQEFLTSGFARVVVPVRPGFESAVEHYRQTGQIWTGGKLPDITDPDYLPIAEEIKARQNAGGNEIPVGEPWEVLLPTQLVKLRPDNSLPEWEKQADGTWTEKQNSV